MARVSLSPPSTLANSWASHVAALSRAAASGIRPSDSAVVERPDDASRGHAIARPGLTLRAGDPGPAAVLVLERDQLGDQPADPIGQADGLGRARRLGPLQVSDRGPGRQQVAGAVGRGVGRPGDAEPRAALDRVGVLAHRQLDEHPPHGGGDHDEHLGLLVPAAGRQGDERGRVVGGRARRRGERLDPPRADRHRDRHLVLRLAQGRGQREPDLVAVGHVERVEQDLLDAVGLDLDPLRLDALPAPGVDRQPQLQRADDAPVMHLGREPGLVALGQGGRHLQVDEEVLPHREVGRGLADERVAAGHAPGGESVLGERGRGAELDDRLAVLAGDDRGVPVGRLDEPLALRAGGSTRPPCPSDRRVAASDGRAFCPESAEPLVRRTPSLSEESKAATAPSSGDSSAATPLLAAPAREPLLVESAI